jgi:hypothetical protein
MKNKIDELIDTLEIDQWEYQHEETGQIGYVDHQQVEWGFEKNNPRHQLISPVYSKIQVIKFAKLIIQECIDMCDEVDRINKYHIEKDFIDPEWGPKECIEIIRNHFGVEDETN